MENATTFGVQAETYQSSRPTYPDELFDWIAQQAPGLQIVWDVGTGSGQAALKLADRFSHVHATDIDERQLSKALAHSRVTFAAAPAHVSGLEPKSVDAITVATALHWFDHEKFWPEVQRVARPNAIFCAWTYYHATTETDVQTLLLDPLSDILAPYWSEGNRMSERGYSQQELKMPFEPVSMPEFACNLQWTPAQIAAFTRSWSAYLKAWNDGHSEKLAAIETNALAKLGNEPRRYILPLNSIAARVL